MRTETTGKNVFAERNFRLVFFGGLVSELGAVLYSFAVSFYILEISGNDPSCRACIWPSAARCSC